MRTKISDEAKHGYEIPSNLIDIFQVQYDLTRARKASCELPRSRRKKHPHPKHKAVKSIINKQLIENIKRDAELIWLRMRTAAYFSTKGRKTGSARRALSDGSWSRSLFSPLRSSLRHQSNATNIFKLS